MSDLVGNPEDRFSRVEARIIMKNWQALGIARIVFTSKMLSVKKMLYRLDVMLTPIHLCYY